MRRRQLRFQYLLAAVALAVVSAILFTKLLFPLEAIVVRFFSSIFIGYHSYVVPLAPGKSDVGSETRIIAKHANAFENTFLLNKQFRAGSKVIKDGVLVGFVVGEGELSQKAEALSAPFRRVTGVSYRSGIPIELEGKGADILEARVPRGTDIVTGDNIMYDEGEMFVIGPVVHLIDVPSDPFVVVLVQSPVNLVALTTVEIK